MAKKKETKKEMEVVNEFKEVKTPEVVEQPKTETKVMEKPLPKKDTWEIKDRLYYLIGNKKPLTYTMRSSGIYWFDEEVGHERELKHTSNQRTSFVDEMKGDQRMEHIIFKSGSLYVPREKVILQKLLSLYHPHRDKLFYEFKPVQKAKNEVAWLEFELAAMNAAKEIDIDIVEAIMRVELGSKVSKMSSKELRRDCLLYARNKPRLFMELVSDDNVQLRNFGIKATEMGIIKLSPDQRMFMWGSNDRKLCTVPYDEHPYSALAAWFKTDEGMEIYSNIEKQLK